MTEKLTQEFFVNNRKRLRETIDKNLPAIVTSAGQMQRGGDIAYPFHQDANFYYLTGIDEPDILLVLDDSEDYLILSKNSDYRDIFDGSIDEQNLSLVSGIKTIMPYQAGWQRLETKIRRSRYVATALAPEPYLETYGLYTNPARANLINKLISINPIIEILDLRMQLARMRMIKQPEEIKVVQAAIDLTIDALNLVQRKLPKMKYEYEVEAEITGHFIRYGADPAWKPTVASGKNATTMHYNSGRGPISNNDLLLIDIGAEVSHYASDICRTYIVGKKPTARQQAVHVAVQKVQDFAFEHLKPGIIIKEYERQIEVFMGNVLQEIGLIKKKDRSHIRKYFPHATSHFLGLEPHDAGDYDQPLEPGVILTVEPGIYIPEEGLGVRIEDDVMIVKDGIKVLTDRLSRALT